MWLRFVKGSVQYQYGVAGATQGFYKGECVVYTLLLLDGGRRHIAESRFLSLRCARPNKLWSVAEVFLMFWPILDLVPEGSFPHIIKGLKPLIKLL